MKLNENIEITNEDNMILMARYPDNYFDLAVVDPPYRDNNQPTKDMRSNGSMNTIKGRPTQKYFEELSRVSKDQIIWGANNFQLPQFKGFLIWDKGIPFDFTMSMAEIASFSEGISTISKIYKLRIAGAEKRIHPTQKPVKLYEWILKKYAKENFKILDTHLGSGNIIKALDKVNKLDKMNLSIVACEIDKEYFEASIKNIKLETDINTIKFK